MLSRYFVASYTSLVDENLLIELSPLSCQPQFVIGVQAEHGEEVESGCPADELERTGSIRASRQSNVNFLDNLLFP